MCMVYRKNHKIIVTAIDAARLITKDLENSETFIYSP